MKRQAVLMIGCTLMAWNLGLGPSGAASLELHQVYSMALRQNEEIQISKEGIEIRHLDKRRALSAILPKLSVDGNYTYYPEETTDIAGASVTLQPEESYGLELNLEQPIYAGGKNRAGMRIAEKEFQVAERAFDETREALLIRVAELFYEVLKGQRNLESQQRNVGRLMEHRRLSELRVKVGEVTQTVLLRAEAELAEAQAEMVGIETRLEVLKHELQIVAGIPGDYEVIEPVLPGIPKEASHELIELALHRRNDVIQSRIQESIAMDQIKLARGNFLPRVTLNGTYFSRNQDPKSTFFIEDSWFIGGRIEIPLFEGGLHVAELSQARARLEQSRLDQSRIRKEAGLEVTRATLSLEAITRTLKARNKQREFAVRNFEMVEKQFTFGVATNLDLLDANQTLVTADRDVIRATYDQHMAILNLQRSAGLYLSEVMGGVQENL